jgi:hypothetical protein
MLKAASTLTGMTSNFKREQPANWIRLGCHSGPIHFPSTEWHFKRSPSKRLKCLLDKVLHFAFCIPRSGTR